MELGSQSWADCLAAELFLIGSLDTVFVGRWSWEQLGSLDTVFVGRWSWEQLVLWTLSL